jgi:uncharacterized protein YjlB
MADPETHSFAPNGRVPNSRLPLLVYRSAVAGGDDTPSAIEELFRANGWLNNWHYPGIYDYAHFHSTTHEVLGIVAGSASVILGGPSGRRFEVGRGDVLVLPAGTGHCNAGSSAALLVVGSYPTGCAGTCAAATLGSTAKYRQTSPRFRCQKVIQYVDPAARRRSSGAPLADGRNAFRRKLSATPLLRRRLEAPHGCRGLMRSSSRRKSATRKSRRIGRTGGGTSRRLSSWTSSGAVRLCRRPRVTRSQHPAASTF